jgi:regulator of nucleoside diphosphate kinase
MVVTDRDIRQLERCLDLAFESRNGNDWESARVFRDLLQNAQIVEQNEVPPDVVTIGSIVLLKECETQIERVWTLVFPACAPNTESRVSVLSSAGMALLGSRVGDNVECIRAGQPKRLTVVDIIYQPKAAAHCNRWG